MRYKNNNKEKKNQAGARFQAGLNHQSITKILQENYRFIKFIAEL